MAACAQCRRNISSVDSKKAHVIRDERGKVKALYHHKCWFVHLKRERFAQEGRNQGPDAYEASAARQTRDDVTDEAMRRRLEAQAEYDRLRELRVSEDGDPELVGAQGGEGEAALEKLLHDAEQDVILARRQEELAEDRAQEDVPREWSDWRDPESKEI